MLSTNFNEFSSGLNGYFDSVVNNNETLIIKRNNGKDAVMISFEEFSSIMETAHLLSSKANRLRLQESIKQMNSGIVVNAQLMEE